MIEGNRFCFFRHLLWIVWIQNGWLCFQNFKDTFCGDGGTGNHDEDGRNDHEGDQYVHGILQEGHHGTDLHGAGIDLPGTIPDDQYGHKAHQKGHGRHHHCHQAVDKDIDTGDVFVYGIKAFFFRLLVVEGTDDKHSLQLLPGDKIESVNELLDLFEAGHRQDEGYKHQYDDGSDNPQQDREHTGIAQYLQQGCQPHQRCKQHNPQHHRDDLLHLLNIIGCSCNQRGSGKVGEFFTGKGFHPGKDISAHITAGTGCGAGSQISRNQCGQ